MASTDHREGAPVLTDQQIAAMTPADRSDLIARLARPMEEATPEALPLQTPRTLRLGLLVLASALMVPWIIYLAIALPGVHEVRDWDVLWTGFDGIELLLFVGTLWLAWQRRALALLTAFATGVVLLCDAWFDLLTANPGQLPQSIAAAVLLEIPMAVLLMSGALRLLRVSMAMLWFAEKGTHVWQVRFPRRRQG